MGAIKIASVWCILAVMAAVVSNEIQMAEGSQVYTECLDYCKIEFKKDPLTCIIFCNMRCMHSLGYSCRDTGVHQLQGPKGSEPEPNIGEAENSEQPVSPVLQSIAQSPLPQFFEIMENKDSIPELKQYLEANALPPS